MNYSQRYFAMSSSCSSSRCHRVVYSRIIPIILIGSIGIGIGISTIVIVVADLYGDIDISQYDALYVFAVMVDIYLGERYSKD